VSNTETHQSTSGPATQSISNILYAEVAVTLHLDTTLTYCLPPELSPLAQIGARIVVPVGKRLVTGFIVDLTDTLPAGKDLSEKTVKAANKILDSIPVCTPEVLAITKWVSDYYACPWGEVIKAALPPGISPAINEYYSITEAGIDSIDSSDPCSLQTQLLRKLHENGLAAKDTLMNVFPTSKLPAILRKLEQMDFVVRSQVESGDYTRAKTRLWVRLVHSATLDPDRQKIRESGMRVISALERLGPTPLQSLIKTAGVSASTLRSLQNKGVLAIYDAAVRRDPLAHVSQTTTEYVLTAGQTSVLEKVNSQLRTGSYGALLLHGVTGSGKTEVYIRAMRSALDLGRSAMMLVPEIALTPVFSHRLRAHFGDQVAIFHSSLQKGERFDEWSRVRNGEAKIVIGTRSAVFAPIKNLGLIVIDEEHEPSYRQQDYPFYNGRDTAIVRARQESATVVLGSATPSLESFQNARNGKYQYLSLPERIGSRPMATARLVDMRDVFARHGKPRVFSDELLTAIRETHERQEQAIILLNRRGYSRFVFCRSCGESLQCPNCDVTLTYHRDQQVMLCHYCNHRQRPPSICANCGKKYIQYVGEGTEQLEALLNDLFPDLRIARIDRDTTVRRRFFEQTLLDFAEGRIDMLVGTQMLAKGHDFPNCTLVGVVSVDTGLALPDFRAAERTFQLITQVAGRAGRGDRPGQVLIQTYHPHHYALRHACAQDYESFYNEEIRYRRNHSYPPFVGLATLLVHGPDLSRVRSTALELRTQLDLANTDRVVRILGPAPAPLSRLKSEHRFQLLLKSTSRRQIRKVVDAALKALADARVNLRSINLEIDPVSVM
jgi:primosomal protein N' (replication factor Y)